MKNLIKIFIISLPIILQLIECQYISRDNHYFHDPYKSGVRYTPKRFNFDNHQNGYNIYRNFNNDYKSDKSPFGYEKPETLHYYYKHKPIKPIEPIILPVIRTKSWTTIKPIHTEQFAEDYSEDEYKGYKGPDSENSYVDYEKDDQENHSKDFKELGKIN